MSRGLTIAELVQKVFYAMYKVRLDVAYSEDSGSFHADTDKFKEVVMEANFVLQDLQKDQDWNWLRKRWCVGTAEVLPDNRIMEFMLPEDAYKVATGYGDAVRLHNPRNEHIFVTVPYVSPRSGTVNEVSMFDVRGRLNMPDHSLKAFVVGDTLTFSRPFNRYENGAVIETDYIRLFDELHICGAECVQPCPKAYRERVLTEVTDPQFIIVKTAAKRAEGDPSIADRVMVLTEDATKLLSAMRENDSSKTFPDTYVTAELGYERVL